MLSPLRVLDLKNFRHWTFVVLSVLSHIMLTQKCISYNFLILALFCACFVTTTYLPLVSCSVVEVIFLCKFIKFFIHGLF